MEMATPEDGFFSQTLTPYVLARITQRLPQPQTSISTLMFARHTMKAPPPAFNVRCSPMILVVFLAFRHFLQAKKLKIQPLGMASRKQLYYNVLQRLSHQIPLHPTMKKITSPGENESVLDAANYQV
jgi:hypothetical protein